MTPDEIRSHISPETADLIGKVASADPVAVVITIHGFMLDFLKELTAQLAEIKDLLKEQKG